MIKCLYLCFIIVFFSSFNGIAAKDATKVSWDTLKELNYTTGEVTSTLNALEGHVIQIEGFIVPLELDDFIDSVIEFLLVPDPLACLHVPPPPPNQILFVSMKQPIPLDMDYRGISIKGRLTIPKTQIEVTEEDASALVGFYLEGFSAEEANIQFSDPFLELYYY